ncbi:hypothetical protein FT663_00375 [Candidozyma haemuli var. vulneris]|uniref:Mitochondrial import inner membrane translocase subunit TIM50 n=1 Tax=Candidozyma haemuli TaxID=45357 RepID=A0A2V1AV73_9ASCO|nr:hypothetical protein CXQ85_000660 [[Candida] haemuloni]KAF3986544.1 hypothetical protein FT662_04488 [[Candida] haemuloni var. vulneris]KAF3995484.1 hypothetical protein FT663_00375 [[Candida] haemuloni var. vulneris]PVH21674.1 hypothetical protein CXQ85_000660 [[Candida] haemuloni]
MLARSLLRATMPRGQLAVRAVPAVQKPRFFSHSSLSYNEKKKDEKPKSILDDDMLAKAGFEEEPSAEEKKEETTDKSSRRKRRTQTTKDRQREKWANIFYGSMLVGGIGALGYMSRDWDSAEEQKELEALDIENGYTPGLMYERLSKRWSKAFSFFSEPVFENLLPPPPPEAYRRPLTLVLALDDLLIHSSWDTKHGWRTAKRPGLDYFLGYLSQYYEIVIFSTNYQMSSERTVMKMDPLRAYIQYALYREACRYKDGKLIKDLSLLNRDLAKTVAVEVDPDTVSMQKDNAVVLKPWNGESDTALVDLIPLLEYLATQPIKDVRPVIKSFSESDDVITEYKKREARLREKWKEENKHLFERAGKPNIGTFLGSMVGMSPSALSKEPKMPLDLIREHGQAQYENLQKFLRENAPKFMEEEQKMKDEFGKMTLNKLMTEGMPTPEDIAKQQAEKAEAEKLQA